MPKTRIALVNDYELVVWGLVSMLEGADDLEVVQAEIRDTPDVEVDLALIDAFGSPQGGLTYARAIIEEGKARRVAIYTWHGDRSLIDDALDLGVAGYFSKAMTSDELISAIEKVVSGDTFVSSDFPVRTPSVVWQVLSSESQLTEREAEIVALLSAGLTNSAIGESLYVSENTIKTNLKRIYKKLGVSNRAQAAVRATELGLQPRRPANHA